MPWTWQRWSVSQKTGSQGSRGCRVEPTSNPTSSICMLRLSSTCQVECLLCVHRHYHLLFWTAPETCTEHNTVSNRTPRQMNNWTVLTYGMLFCVNTYGRHKLWKTLPNFLAHPIYGTACVKGFNHSLRKILIIFMLILCCTFMGQISPIYTTPFLPQHKTSHWPWPWADLDSVCIYVDLLRLTPISRPCYTIRTGFLCSNDWSSKSHAWYISHCQVRHRHT